MAVIKYYVKNLHKDSPYFEEMSNNGITVEEGDLVEATQDCSHCIRGNQYYVAKSVELGLGMNVGTKEKPQIGCQCFTSWKLIKKHNHTSPKTMSTKNPIEVYKELQTKEPAKTFIATGITDNQNNLTPEGQDLFIAWLFEQHTAEFKKEVADKILAETKKAK